MLKVLLLSRNAEMAEAFSTDLEGEGYSVLVAQALESATETSPGVPDAVVWDVTGSPVTPEEVGRQVRTIKEAIDAPVLLVMDEGMAKEYDPFWGVDDIFCGIPGKVELLLRIRQALGRSGKLDGETVIRYGDLVIDPSRYQVWLAGRPVALTFKEYELLRLLASNKGKVFTRETLLNRIWGHDYYGGDRTVDVHVRRLRSKLEDGSHKFIDTVRNVGYRFMDLPSAKD